MSPQHHQHVPDVTLMSYEKSKYYAGTLYSGLQPKIKVLNDNRNTFMAAFKHYPLILLHCKWIFFQPKICNAAWLLRNFWHRYFATFLVCIIWFAYIIMLKAVQTMEFTFVFYPIHTMVCSLYLYYTGHIGSKSIKLGRHDKVLFIKQEHIHRSKHIYLPETFLI